MNKLWKQGYKGICFHLNIGERPCWKTHFSSTLWQISLGYIQFVIWFYDHAAAIHDFHKETQEDENRN